jgi:hypothetical protein
VKLKRRALLMFRSTLELQNPEGFRLTGELGTNDSQENSVLRKLDAEA